MPGTRPCRDAARCGDCRYLLHDRDTKYTQSFRAIIASTELLALPARSPEEAAQVLVSLARRHDFTFYKYQMADLVSLVEPFYSRARLADALRLYSSEWAAEDVGALPAGP